MTGTDATSARGRAESKKPSPLIRVLSQIRWPQLSGGLPGDDIADGLAKKIGADYPRRGKVSGVQMVITPQSVTQEPGETVHQFLSADQAWNVTLGASFITLETSRYTSHEEFVPKLGSLVEALTSVQPIPVWDRFGYRYTNRITDGADITDLSELFDSAVLGLVPLQQTGQLTQSVTEAVVDYQGTSLLVRSAYLLAGGTIDPTIPGINVPSWFLDLDAFSGASTVELTRARAEEQANTLSTKAHDFFTKVSKDEYRVRYL